MKQADYDRAITGDKALSEADLYRADLHGADLYRADLHRADLHGANLREANLREADPAVVRTRYEHMDRHVRWLAKSGGTAA